MSSPASFSLIYLLLFLFPFCSPWFRSLFNCHFFFFSFSSVFSFLSFRLSSSPHFIILSFFYIHLFLIYFPFAPNVFPICFYAILFCLFCLLPLLYSFHFPFTPPLPYNFFPFFSPSSMPFFPIPQSITDSHSRLLTLFHQYISLSLFN